MPKGFLVVKGISYFAKRIYAANLTNIDIFFSGHVIINRGKYFQKITKIISGGHPNSKTKKVCRQVFKLKLEFSSDTEKEAAFSFSVNGLVKPRNNIVEGNHVKPDAAAINSGVAQLCIAKLWVIVFDISRIGKGIEVGGKWNGIKLTDRHP